MPWCLPDKLWRSSSGPSLTEDQRVVAGYKADIQTLEAHIAKMNVKIASSNMQVALYGKNRDEGRQRQAARDGLIAQKHKAELEKKVDGLNGLIMAVEVAAVSALSQINHEDTVKFFNKINKKLSNSNNTQKLTQVLHDHHDINETNQMLPVDTEALQGQIGYHDLDDDVNDVCRRMNEQIQSTTSYADTYATARRPPTAYAVNQSHDKQRLLDSPTSSTRSMHDVSLNSSAPIKIKIVNKPKKVQYNEKPDRYVVEDWNEDSQNDIMLDALDYDTR